MGGGASEFSVFAMAAAQSPLLSGLTYYIVRYASRPKRRSRMLDITVRVGLKNRSLSPGAYTYRGLSGFIPDR